MSQHKYVKLTYSDVAKIRDQYIQSSAICPILRLPLTKENAVVDHKHITKKDIKKGQTGVDGKGLLRGVIHNYGNVFLGKVEKAFVRSGCRNVKDDLPGILRDMATFLEAPPIEQKFIHPTERVKRATLTQIEYQRICKYYFQMFPRKRKLPPYPKRKKNNMTKKWVRLINMANELNTPIYKRAVVRVSSSPKIKTPKTLKRVRG